MKRDFKSVDITQIAKFRARDGSGVRRGYRSKSAGVDAENFEYAPNRKEKG